MVSLGRKIYVIGGYSHPGRHGRGIDVYDSHDGQWRQISDGLRHRRTDSVAAAVAGRFYVIGGIDQASSDSVESYDPVTQTWARMDARMPTGRSALGVAVVHGLIFTIGGVCVDGQGIVLDSMEKYDPKSGVWTRLSSMPTARCAMGVAVLGGNIYVAGGRGAGYVALQVVEVFDPQEGTWTSLSPMVEPRAGCGLVVIGGMLMAVGGASEFHSHGTPHQEHMLASSERYIAATDQWVVLRDENTRGIDMLQPRKLPVLVAM